MQWKRWRGEEGPKKTAAIYGNVHHSGSKHKPKGCFQSAHEVMSLMYQFGLLFVAFLTLSWRSGVSIILCKLVQGVSPIEDGGQHDLGSGWRVGVEFAPNSVRVLSTCEGHPLWLSRASWAVIRRWGRCFFLSWPYEVGEFSVSSRWFDSSRFRSLHKLFYRLFFRIFSLWAYNVASLLLLFANRCAPNASSQSTFRRLLSSAINWGGLIYDARQDIDLFLRTTCNAFLTFFAYITTELNKYAWSNFFGLDKFPTNILSQRRNFLFSKSNFSLAMLVECWPFDLL